MKNFKKFIPAVLAAATLASCSGDDLLVIEGTPQGGDNAGLAKNVTVETPEINFGSVTRAGYTMSDFANLKFEDGDELRAYDGDFVKYDTYAYDKTSTKFVMKGDKQYAPAPSYSVFPAKDFTYGTWGTDENGDETAMALVTIPYEFTIDSKSQWKVGVDENNEYAYKTFLPMAGTATAAGERDMNAKLYFITAGIILVLDNTKGVVDYVRVVSDTDHALTGAFDTNLKQYDGASTANLPVLKTAAEVDGINQKNEMIVNIDYTSAVGSRYVVTLPIIQGDYHSLKVYVGSRQPGVSEQLIKEWSCNGKEGKADHGGAVFNRRQLYGVQYNADVTITDPNGLSTALENKQDLTKDVVLTISDEVDFVVSEKNSGRGEEHYTVYVPEMKAEKLVINIPQTIKNSITGQNFVIRDADPAHPYTGEVVLRLGGVTDGAYTTYTEAIDEGGIEINLTEADVTLAGYFTKPITVENVHSITFGDPESPAAGDYRNTVVGKDATVKLKNVTKAVTIAEGAEYKQDLDLTSPTLAGKAKKDKDFTLTINGLMEQNAGVVKAGYATTTIGGGVYAQWVNQDQVKELYTRGNVIVNQSVKASSKAAVGTLEILGDEDDDNVTKTLSLECGYINKLQGNATKKTPLTVNNVEKGATGIGGIQDLTDTDYTGKKVNSTFEGSTWAGLTLNSALDRSTETGVIYTASQLAGRCAESQVTSEYKVYTTMDLNNIKWTGTDLNKQFNGNSKTIKNLKLRNKSNSAANSRANAGTGLFSEVKGATIKSVTLNDVTFEQIADGVEDADNNKYKYYDNANMGAIAGIVSGTTTLDKVVVTNAEFKGFGGNNATLQNVGLLIGKVVNDGTADVTVNVKNQSAVKGNLSITGAYHSLGGIAGYVEGDAATSSPKTTTVHFEKFTVAKTTFEVTKALESGYDRDANFGKVGKVVGSAWKTVAVEIDDHSVYTGDFDQSALHFDYNKVTYTPSGKTQGITRVFTSDNMGWNHLGFSDKQGNVTLKYEDGVTSYVNQWNGTEPVDENNINGSTRFNVFK